MQNKKLVMLIVLSFFAIISLIYGIITPPKARRGVKLEKVATPTRQEMNVPEDILFMRRAKRSNYLSWLTNPFMPGGDVETALRLNGIVWDSESPKAIINDDIVGIGSMVGKDIIVDIQKDKVILNNGSSDFELKLLD